METVGKNGYDGNNLRFMNTVSGGDLQWMIEKGFTKNELINFRYPSEEEFEKKREFRLFTLVGSGTIGPVLTTGCIQRHWV